MLRTKKNQFKKKDDKEKNSRTRVIGLIDNLNNIITINKQTKNNNEKIIRL